MGEHGRFRPMVLADLPAVLAIERAAHAFPWTEGIFRDCLTMQYDCTVVEDGHGEIVAYTVLSAIVAGEVDLLNVAVRPDRQGEGWARSTLAHVFLWASTEGAQNIFLEVRPSNRRAVQLYQKAGFCEVGVRPKYYPAAQGREDALIMAKVLLGGA